jgi:hypothetical protein
MKMYRSFMPSLFAAPIVLSLGATSRQVDSFEDGNELRKGSMTHQMAFTSRWFATTLITLAFVFASTMSWADDDENELTLATLKFFIEFNETDEDIGVQALLGGEPYKRLSAFGPDERKILDLRPRRGLKMQGMSDFFLRERRADARRVFTR